MERCLEVDLKESLIFSANSPTVALPLSFKCFKISSRRRFAKAFKIFSYSFMFEFYHSFFYLPIRENKTIDEMVKL